MIYIIFLTLIVFLIIDFFKDKKIISPIKIFNFIWLFVLGLYYLKLSNLQQDFHFRTLLIFFLCILFYNITCFFMLYIKKQVRENKQLFQKRIYIKEYLKYINIGFIIIFIIECIYSRGFPLLDKILTGNSNYLNFGITSLHGVLNGLAITLGAYYICKKSKWQYLYIAFAVITVSRQVLISIIIQAIIFSILNTINNKQKINYKKYLLIGIFIIIGFVIIGNFRSGSDVMTITFQAKYPNLPNWLMWIYSYTEFSLSNFNNLVGMTDGMVNYGLSSLQFFLPSIVLKIFNISPIWKENYLIQNNFNVSTWFPEIYLDFGLLGIIVFSIIVGILGSYLYKKAINEYSDKNALMYAVFSHNILFFFFVNMFLYIPIFAQFIYIPIIFCEKKDDKKQKKLKETNKIAILMATYNGEKYLEEQIKSIINQTYNNFILYIRDDNSTDNTIEIINKYKKMYSDKIIIVKDKKNTRGACQNFITLLENVSKIKEHNLFMFCDQDDVWNNDKIEITIEKYNNLEKKDIPILIHTDLTVVDSTLNTISQSFINYSNLNSNAQTFNKYLVQNNVTGCTVLINRELVDLVKFDYTKQIIMHDWYFALLASALGKVIFINESTMKYRQHTSNVLGAKKIKGIKGLYNKLIKNNTIKKELQKTFEQAEYIKETCYNLLDSDTQKTLNDFLKIKKANKFKKIYLIIKNKFYKQSLIRTIFELIYI